MLPSWWQIAIPHKDIREGQLNEAIFAADLGDVYNKKAPLEYNDPILFFQKTYLTKGLKILLENVLSRLSSGKGDPVIQLQTPFGGGKTHSLLTLYHIIKNRKEIAHLPFISELPEIKDAKVAVFVGTHADVISGRTLWGEIAFQLGQYEIIKDHDKKRISPGKEKFRQVLEAAGSTLILLDELLEYIIKANRVEKIEKIIQGQTLAFIQELTELIAVSDKSTLVITLPTSTFEQYDEETEKVLQQLQKISGRVETIYIPVEDVELYEIIRTRLFENIGDEKTRREVAQSYFNFYQKLGINVPPEVIDIEYRDKIISAYPFHPELIDVLYKRWGTLPTFQRTRGVLRILAEIVADFYKQKISSPLIQSSLINLENQLIRKEFIKHIGNEYDNVISTDIVGKDAKALKIDKEMGSEYEKYGIAKGIATSVFINSFSAEGNKEITLPRIRVALLREGMPLTIIDDAIAKLEEELWYFHSKNKQYAFRSQPNLNCIIVNKEEIITDSKIKEKLKEEVQNIAGKAFEIYLYPKNIQDIPDNKNLKLVILSPDFLYDSKEGEKFVSEFFEKAGKSFRVYKNTLFALAMNNHQYLTLFKSLKRFLALTEIQQDKNLMEKLDKENQEELKRKLKEIKKDLPIKILNAYNYLAMLGLNGVNWIDLGIPTIKTNNTISEKVKQYLINQEKILSYVTPKYIIDKTFAKDENEKSLHEIYELPFKTPGMFLLENEQVLFNTIQEGVKNGVFGIKNDTTIYFKQEASLTMNSIVLRKEIIKQIEEQKPEIKNIIEEKKEIVKSLSLKAKISWDNLPSVIKGIIYPLKEKESLPEITIEIKAKTEKNFDRLTLDNKIKETLKQINAEIKEWKEE